MQEALSETANTVVHRIPCLYNESTVLDLPGQGHFGLLCEAKHSAFNTN